MRVTVMATSSCEGGNCPTTYVSDRASVLIQGDEVTGDAGLMPGLVEVPLTLLEEHARLQGASRWITPTHPGRTGTVVVSGIPVTDVEALAAVPLPTGETLIELFGTVVA